MIAQMRKPRGGFPVSMEVVEARWAAAIIGDAGLDNDSLSNRGVNVGNLAVCIQHELVVTEELSGTLERMSADEFNGALENLMDRIPAIKAHPTSIVDQCLHMNDLLAHNGEQICSCGVDYIQ